MEPSGKGSKGEERDLPCLGKFLLCAELSSQVLLHPHSPHLHGLGLEIPPHHHHPLTGSSLQHSWLLLHLHIPVYSCVNVGTAELKSKA